MSNTQAKLILHLVKTNDLTFFVNQNSLVLMNNGRGIVQDGKLMCGGGEGGEVPDGNIAGRESSGYAKRMGMELSGYYKR